jgi:hypothetical protein
MTPKGATVGDALIFMTKAIGVLLAAAALAGGLAWYDNSYYAELKDTQTKLQSVRDLDNASLNDLQAELAERASKMVEMFCGPAAIPNANVTEDWCSEMSALAKHSVTTGKTLPTPPPGFVIERQPGLPRNLLADE